MVTKPATHKPAKSAKKAPIKLKASKKPAKAAKLVPAAKKAAAKPVKPVKLSPKEIKAAAKAAELAKRAKAEPKLTAKQKAAALKAQMEAAKKAAKKAASVVKPSAKPLAKRPGESETPGDADSPLLDMSDVGVRKMIAKAKTRGYVTYDELNKVLPSDKTSSEQIEDTMAMLSEMGINVIESE